MHIAGALISTAVASATGAGSGGALISGCYRMRGKKKDIMLMGAAGAAVFAAQMINFSIGGTGSSGHICGAFLLSAILGPLPAYLVMTVILVVQSLLFGDGGLLALGANIFNMGLIPCFLIYPAVNKLFLSRGSFSAKASGLFIGGMLSVITGAAAVEVEAVLSGTVSDMGVFAANLMGIHLLIGAAEGLCTCVLCCGFDAVYKKSRSSALVLTGIFAALASGVLSLFASAAPDGLEWSLIKASGIDSSAANSPAHILFDEIQSATTLLPDYAFETVKTALSSSAAGIIGSACVFLIIAIAGAALRKIFRTQEGR